MERIPMTPDGFEKMRQELKKLKSVERPRIITEIEEARAHGDLSENAEYHAAKERKGHVDGRILDVELWLSKAEVIDPVKMKGREEVFFGAYVTLVDMNDDTRLCYQIVGEFESDIASNKISIKSPIARALLGKKKSSEVSVKTPKGIKEFEIVGVEYK